MSSTVMVIESGMAGLVIGRGGSRIKNIQQDSGTTVKLSDGDTAGTKKVTITGGDDARLSASEMIKKIVGKVLHSETCAAPPPKNSRVQKPPRKQRSRSEPSPPEKLTISDEVWAEIERENAERDRLRMESLVPIKKDFYVEHDEVKALSVEEVEAFRLSKNNIMVGYVDGADTSRPIPKPIKTFHHAFHAYPKILNVIQKQKFTEPSPVQCQAWPIIMSGHDLVAIAQTGTGKTLAYILPAIINLLGQPTIRKNRIGPSVVVLGPTRELILQIEGEIKKYIFDDIGVISVYGGVPTQSQSEILINQKPDIVVATPGRLNDLIGVNAVNLEHVSYLVLDEADRMLDMGFKNQIELSLRHVRPDKQTILTSATWPTSVQKLVNYFATNPLHITIGTLDLATVNTVEQKVIVLKEYQKEAWLDDFLKKKMSKRDKVIIFMLKKVSVDKLFEKMKSQNIECR